MTDITHFYTNAAIVGFSAYDLTLVFQRRSFPVGSTPMPAAGRVDVQSQVVSEVHVVTSPRHAKVLAAVLLDSIANFEMQNGEIHLSPEERQKLVEALAKFGVKGKSQ